ncbi:WXG100 family type VII secretion target [Nocardioides zeae]|uniref:WXG100 family type VII secretion target n=1 Tax=Nocardioides imazamoxiresistens TaxID=3231893 RepID=A0ABU3PUJ4_9ACTN|nr:WXG100 family type VII secretion target [Nocardioides zeae]MDT9592892.1 WXG100 family type VII secretion target [Nocardioides zeae]
MGFVGADVEELRALATELESGAGELRDLGAQLAASIQAASSWQGADAERCKSEWGGLAQTQVADVAAALEDAGRIVERNADEQEGISSADSVRPDGYGWLGLVPGGVATARAVQKLWGAGKGLLGLGAFFDALKHPARGFGALSRFEKVRDAIEAVLATRKTGILGMLSRISVPLTMVTAGWEAITGTGYEGWRDVAGRGFAAAGALGAATLVIGGTALAAPVATAAAIGVAAYGVWSAGNFVYDNRAAIGDFVSRTYEGARGWVSEQGTRALDAARAWAAGFLGGARTAGAGA